MLTTIVAIYSAFIGDGITAWLIAYCIAFIVLLVTVIWCYAKLAYFLAKLWMPWLLEHNQLWIAERLFGFRVSALALNEAATRLMRGEQFESACRMLDSALEFDKSFATLWSNRGNCRARLGQLEEAKADANEALAIEADHESALWLRGMVRTLQADYLGAIGDLERVECTQAKHFIAAFYRGLAREALKQWELAMSDYVLASQLDVTQTEAALALTRIQACCPVDELRDGRKALENATNICNRTLWQDWVSISVLAAAYAECGNFESALKYAQLALELAPAEEKASRQDRIDKYQRREAHRL